MRAKPRGLTWYYGFLHLLGWGREREGVVCPSSAISQYRTNGRSLLLTVSERTHVTTTTTTTLRQGRQAPAPGLDLQGCLFIPLHDDSDLYPPRVPRNVG
eukprot:TRINITY_DN2752_c0_g2_i5.p3 TRINITY_DN2752_c0_g2~~TRINITY_DN2752_c0_g2_i5.p3  ORF type:complete len:100 (+),score=4.02 TRINITY_DN2752_c0_g2_i5:81-380(+)